MLDGSIRGKAPDFVEVVMPLSEYEQRVLAEMEQQLSSDDPQLATSLATPSAPRRARVALGVFVVLVGLALLVIGMTVSLIWFSLLGFAVMFAGAYLAVSSPRGVRAPAAPKAPKPPSAGGGFTKRFEDRWNERRGE
jgi:Na+-transporting methylmalonyl-CoA/oxaloacetate decarboxylase gamma subunit